MDVGQAESAASTEVSRARRYEIGTLIRYRVRGEREWHEGVTENISISGVLIRANEPLDPQTAIEMRFLLPIELDGESAAEVFCRGLVIRSSKCRFPAGTVTIATKIVHFRFLRPTGDPLERAKEVVHGDRRLGY